ncbi:MAG: tRNA preQ1(34) S-adenosylmethionine ribosyltransferase-isomerase QueA [Rhodospirillaceae bacterium]|nr:tRNA preQ1(34) S-adenosylmethionine ribosyltransferase-isomerase QueA [Rhodospirillaceae bacterium]|tara:strand:+ start:3782 stop:4816 length:1035 start_codon:yes stop_codon:yes gene_type:complete
MDVNLFDYELPPDFIAQTPINPRDAARLLDLTNGGLKDRFIQELPFILKPGDLLVANNTRVIPTKLQGKCASKRITVNLHKKVSPSIWFAFARPAKRVTEGDLIMFDDSVIAKVLERNHGELLLEFQLSDQDIMGFLEQRGSMPLPPYIKRNEPSSNAADLKDYQSIFAQHEGAVAAPTASLHFTDRLLASLKKNNIDIAYLTLHVGAGTFLPVKVKDTENHDMHSEWAELGSKAVEEIKNVKARGNKVIALGTTSLRVLETASISGTIAPFAGDTDLFITPGFKFNTTDALITNFHLPKSTLIMLASALAGRERLLDAYEHAKRENYRFFSYGDACLIDHFQR